MTCVKDTPLGSMSDELAKQIIYQLTRFRAEVPIEPLNEMHACAYIYGAIASLARFYGCGRCETFVLACRYFVENLGIPIEEVGECVIRVKLTPQKTVQQWRKEGAHALRAWCTATSHA
ncbi:hypothetical protein JWV37_11505 [Sulfurospirillum sp. T05]|uniref:Transposase n=1 Tax=Sulfurospirillum tamanense TaxID=2813362 RepID=A0ABS2WW13_9BACT|nr:hypothetical protein [Sulfurospirillum tamanensis]MBN2965409.1 hypothetical protein [Sulfurospirillum tamanensis]